MVSDLCGRHYTCFRVPGSMPEILGWPKTLVIFFSHAMALEVLSCL